MNHNVIILHNLHKVLRKKLGNKRYHHCVRTATRAAQLAFIYHQDVFQAAVAGLLHDITHSEKNCDTLNFLLCHQYTLEEECINQPQIWHAISGSYLLWDLGLRDTAIIRAVRYHTTARAGMTTLEKIVFVADKTSSDRDYSGVEAIREISEKSLDKAVLAILKGNINMLLDCNMQIAKDTSNAYNYYLAH